MNLSECVAFLNRAGVIVKRTSPKEVYCLCPFHNDKRSSMSVNPEKELWICYRGCGQGTLKELGNLLKTEYVPSLAATTETLNLDSPIDFYSQYSRMEGASSLDLQKFLKSRKLSLSVSTDRFGLRWDSDKKEVVFPVRSPSGKIVGLLRKGFGKVIGPYFDAHSWLYGIYETRDKAGPVVLVEGPIDAIKVCMAGYRVGAILGSKIADKQLAMINSHVILFFDGDEAGLKCTIETAQKLIKMGILPSVCLYSVEEIELKMDPGDMSTNGIRAKVESAMSINITQLMEQTNAVAI